MPHIDLSASWLSRNFSAEDFPIDVTMNDWASTHQLSTASVLCGDTNVSEVAEIRPFVNNGYTDCWAKMDLGTVAESTSPEGELPMSDDWTTY